MLDACIARLESGAVDRRGMEALAHALTVGETYFFRDRKALETLGERVLAPLVRQRSKGGRRLRLLSAGCATGEEAYTLAIMVHKLLPYKGGWNIDIVGVDLDIRALRFAREGLYGKWSFRKGGEDILRRYFHPEGKGRYRINDDLRRMVNFHQRNLAEEKAPRVGRRAGRFRRGPVPQRAHVLCAGEGSDGVAPSVGVPPSKRAPDGLPQRDRPDPGGPVRIRRLHGSAAKEVLGPTGRAYPAAGGQRGVAGGGSRPGNHPGSPPQHHPGHYPGNHPERPRGRARGAGVCAAPRGCRAPDGRHVHPGLGGHGRAGRDPVGPGPLPAGHYADAVDGLERIIGEAALTDSGDWSTAVGLLTRALSNLGNHFRAEEVIRGAVGKDPVNVQLRFQLAGVLLEQDRRAEAEEELHRILYLDQRFVPAHFLLGNIALGQGRGHEAQRHLDNARRLLEHMDGDAVLDGAEGLTVGGFREMLDSIGSQGGA